MKKYLFITMAMLLCTGLLAQTKASKTIDEGGSGPYKAIAVQEETMPDFTIYRPVDLKTAVKKEGKLPVIVYGNGGCRNTSVEHEKLLNNFASYGYVVVAIGPFLETSDPQAAWTVTGSTDASQLSDAIDWIFDESQKKGSEYRKMLDQTKIAAMGQSCGGTQALTACSKDKRVKTGVILNSGLFGGDNPSTGNAGANPFAAMMGGAGNNGGENPFAKMFGGDGNNGGENPFAAMFAGAPKEGESGENPFAKMFAEMAKNGQNAGGGLSGMGGSIGKEGLQDITIPLVYIIGGEGDIAYGNANDDYERLTKIPVAKCNLPVGHLGTYSETYGGEFGVVALKWLDWQLKGKTVESSFFLDDSYVKSNYPKWSVERKNF